MENTHICQILTLNSAPPVCMCNLPFFKFFSTKRCCNYATPTPTTSFLLLFITVSENKLPAFVQKWQVGFSKLHKLYFLKNLFNSRCYCCCCARFSSIACCIFNTTPTKINCNRLQHYRLRCCVPFMAFVCSCTA